MGERITLVCQDRGQYQGCVSFFPNDRVSEADILVGHFQSTRERTIANDGPTLVLHDTTEFSYQSENSDAIGITMSINSGRDKARRLRSHTVCGILMHLEPGVDDRRAAARTDGRQILYPEEIQGDRRAQEEG